MKIVTKKYEEIYEELKDEIVGGGYAKGDKLPSKRAVAFNEDVSLTTVEHAYELLESEGYISGREKRIFCGIRKLLNFRKEEKSG